jgi:hypothetical protein
LPTDFQALSFTSPRAVSTEPAYYRNNETTKTKNARDSETDAGIS